MKISDALINGTKLVTKKWTKQRKSEERRAGRRARRAQAMSRSRSESQIEAVWAVLPIAYREVAGENNRPAKARQIFYRVRPLVQARTGKTITDKYFQTLLAQYQNEHPRETENWKVVYDPRGHFSEPHLDWQKSGSVPMGTLEADRYLASCKLGISPQVILPDIAAYYPTKGPKNRYSAIVYIEKEGFEPLFKETQLAERYDIAIMSGKGQSNVACRKVVDELCGGRGVPLLILHDFDKAGFEIAERLVSTSLAAQESNRERYRFRNNIKPIDLGLRLEDVKRWGLEPEECDFKGNFAHDTTTTKEEQDFLRYGQRVELNAFSSDDFISWIEEKLNEHGIQKVIPSDDVLEDAYRHAYRIAYINNEIAKLSEDSIGKSNDAGVPNDLADKIAEALENNSERPWDAVVNDLAEEHFHNPG